MRRPDGATRTVIEGIAHQYVPLPAEARDCVLPALAQAGIECQPVTGRRAKRYDDAADLFLCRCGEGSAETALVRTESLPTECRHLAAVLISPSVGFFAELRHGEANKAVRERIAKIVSEVKAEAESVRRDTTEGG